LSDFIVLGPCAWKKFNFCIALIFKTLIFDHYFKGANAGCFLPSACCCLLLLAAAYLLLLTCYSPAACLLLAAPCCCLLLLAAAYLLLTCCLPAVACLLARLLACSPAERGNVSGWLE